MIPTPNPMAAALIRFCTGYTRDRAVMASSLIWATKKLSTMLYREFTSMEMIMGRAMDRIRGNTGFSFINVSFIAILHSLICLIFCGTKKRRTIIESDDCVAKKAVKLKNPHEILA